MIEILLNWIWIGLCTFTVGYGLTLLLQKAVGDYYPISVEMVIIIGLCGLTVYAQIFSLFYKVGLAANLVLVVVVCILLVALRTKLREYISDILSKANIKRNVIVFAIVGVIVLLKANQVVDCYDSYLYHAQTVRWIEEYGVVPGLGNLHSRFAFNSSFLVLQALFSMKFLLGRSLHSVNGFFVWILLCYGLLSMKTFKTKRFMVSDGLRLSAFFLISYILYMSSPNTDLMSSGMMIYILIKWTSMWENGEKYYNILPYAILCILGVWTITLKVSSGAVAIMTVFVAYQFLIRKKWKDIAVYLCSGVIVALPWVIRNIMISGYMIYPYGALDLFEVDWKMPLDSVREMSLVVTACGRGTYLGGANAMETSAFGWIPIWFNAQKLLFQVLFVVSVAAILIGLVRCISKIKQKQDCEYTHIFITMAVCFIIWFFGAPDVRFAPSCLTMISFFVFGDIYKSFKMVLLNQYMVVIMAVLCVVCNARFIVRAITSDQGSIVYSTDYDKLEVQQCEWNGQTIYYPVEGSDQVGYDYFPSTPYISNLDIIELRGKELKDGFKTKAVD